MNFDKVIQRIQDSLVEKKLPGQDAQYKMSAFGRKKAVEQNFNKKSHKMAAVMLLLYPERGTVFFPLTQRHEYKGVHSGQVSLPGGKQDPEDESLMQTALRETEEEIGVERSEIQLIGNLTDLYIPPSNFHVHPYVGIVDKKPAMAKEDFEVAEIVEVSLRDFLNDDIIQRTKVKVGNGMRIETPYFNLGGKVVWGATAMILNEFRHLIKEP